MQSKLCRFLHRDLAICHSCQCSSVEAGSLGSTHSSIRPRLSPLKRVSIICCSRILQRKRDVSKRIDTLPTPPAHVQRYQCFGLSACSHGLGQTLFLSPCLPRLPRAFLSFVPAFVLLQATTIRVLPVLVPARVRIVGETRASGTLFEAVAACHAADRQTFGTIVVVALRIALVPRYMPRFLYGSRLQAGVTRPRRKSHWQQMKLSLV